MSKNPAFLLAKLSLVAAVFGAFAACNSTLGLEDYELTDQDRCGDVLVDLAIDVNNCGVCGNVCPAGADCVAATCTCPDNGRFCTDTDSAAQECADLDSSEEHCGACGDSCASGASCEDGECNCDENGESVCSNVCVDMDIDEDNCGTCGTMCAIGASCTAAQCNCDVNGEIACQGACTDPQTDAMHCGMCDHACDIAHATPMCAAAECVADTCETDYLDCDNDLNDGESGTGCEVDGQSDDANCGACGNACPFDRTCDGGECVCDVPAAGGECDPRSNCGCDLGTNCTYGADTWECIQPGFGTTTETCTEHAQCAVGHSCVAGVCHRLCNKLEIEDDACGTNGNCVQVVDQNGDDIDAYQICAEPCNPSTIDSAPFGTITCPYGQQCIVASDTTACAQQGTIYGSMGYVCSTSTDCNQGLGCVDGTCQNYCVMNDQYCDDYFGFNYSCVSFSPSATAAGSEIGYCQDSTPTLSCEDACSPGFDECPGGTSCLETSQFGYICIPSQCQGCWDSDLSCTWDSAFCTFDSCTL